jgi:hypothetical protein
MAGDAVAEKERRARLLLLAAEQVRRAVGRGAVLPAPRRDSDLSGAPTGMMLRQGENFYRRAVREPWIPSLLRRRRVSVN